MRVEKQLQVVVNKIQAERDHFILFTSNIGHRTDIFLKRSYLETNNAVEEIKEWPQNIDSNFRSKFDLANSLHNYRTINDTTKRIYCYSETIKFIVNWLVSGTASLPYDRSWPTLVAYNCIVRCSEALAIMRSHGMLFLSHGSFWNASARTEFIYALSTYEQSYKDASRFSHRVKRLRTLTISHMQNYDVVQVIDHYTKSILLQPTRALKQDDAIYWFDNVTVLIDNIFSMQRDLVSDLQMFLDNTVSFANTKVGISIGLIIASAISLLIGVYFVYQITSDIHSCAVDMMYTNEEIRKDQDKSESLLGRILPKTIVKQVLRHGKVAPEHFNEVTILMLEIDNFSSISQSLGVQETCGTLRKLYKSVDETIDKYNIYKVEMIADCIVVVSGT